MKRLVLVILMLASPVSFAETDKQCVVVMTEDFAFEGGINVKDLTDGELGDLRKSILGELTSRDLKEL